jgi:cytochrome c-type biogenesis protein CcmH
MNRWLMIVLLTLCSLTAQARVEVYQFETPEQEASYKRLIEELRCLVCQNQNLADSNAELAQDLRQKTYEMVIAGKDEQAIIDYMVERYGDFVLYRPPVNATTLLLWVGPFLILFGGVFVLLRVIRRQRRAGATDEVDSDALRRVEQLLENEKDKSL